MLTYKSYYIIEPAYLCELISRKESYVNAWFGADHHQSLLCHQLVGNLNLLTNAA